MLCSLSTVFLFVQDTDLLSDTTGQSKPGLQWQSCQGCIVQPIRARILHILVFRCTDEPITRRCLTLHPTEPTEPESNEPIRYRIAGPRTNPEDGEGSLLFPSNQSDCRILTSPPHWITHWGILEEPGFQPIRACGGLRHWRVVIGC